MIFANFREQNVHFKASVIFWKWKLCHARSCICRFFGIELIKIYLIDSNVSNFENHSTLTCRVTPGEGCHGHVVHLYGFGVQKSEERRGEEGKGNPVSSPPPPFLVPSTCHRLSFPVGGSTSTYCHAPLKERKRLPHMVGIWYNGRGWGRHILPTLLEKFWPISLYVTEDAIEKALCFVK